LGVLQRPRAAKCQEKKKVQTRHQIQVKKKDAKTKLNRSRAVTMLFNHRCHAQPVGSVTQVLFDE
jgi:hypothetical protein